MKQREAEEFEALPEEEKERIQNYPDQEQIQKEQLELAK